MLLGCFQMEWIGRSSEQVVEAGRCKDDLELPVQNALSGYPQKFSRFAEPRGAGYLLLSLHAEHPTLLIVCRL